MRQKQRGKIKIGYFGSPDASTRLLQRLLSEEDMEIVFAVSNPDKRKGRSQKLIPTEVSRMILEENERSSYSQKKKIPLFRYTNLRTPSVADELRGIDTDLFVVFSYGKILPLEIFSLPSFGAINLHASLLPKLRGASPIQTAILKGENRTGWTVQYLSQELDAGDILAQTENLINSEETAGELLDRMLPEGINLLIKTCRMIMEDSVLGEGQKGRPQNHSEADDCGKISKELAKISWDRPIAEIHNLIRAMNPFPVAWSVLPKDISQGDIQDSAQTSVLRIYRTSIVEKNLHRMMMNDLPFGGVILSPDSQSLWVRCLDGILALEELQRNGRQKMTCRDFLNGYKPPTDLVLQ